MDSKYLIDDEINKTFRFDEENVDNNRLFPEEEETITTSTGEKKSYRAEFAEYKDVSEIEAHIPTGDFHMALSEDGKTMIDNYINLEFALQDPKNRGKNFYVFDNEGNNPVCVRATKNGFAASFGGVGPDNQVGKETYEPKASLKLEDVAEFTGSEKEGYKLERKLDEAKDIKKKPKDYLKKYQEEIDAFKKQRNDIGRKVRDEVAAEVGKRPEEIGEKPALIVPHPPKLALGSKISRVLYKIITLGFGETNAYKRHQEALQEYRRVNKPIMDEWKQYRKEERLFKEKFKAQYDDKLAELQAKYDEAKERSKSIDDEITELRADQVLHKETVENKRAEIYEYHSKPEVIMAGIADIQKEGAITQDNIFANTWMHRKAVEGKNPALYNAEDEHHLASFVVSQIAEEKITKNFSENPDHAMGQQNRSILVGINNGSAVETMKNDPVFKGLLKQAKEANKPMSLSAFGKALKEGMKMEIAKKVNPINKLKEAQKVLADGFGKKAPSEDCLQDVAKYNMLSDTIRKLENNLKQNKELSGNDVYVAKSALSDAFTQIRDGAKPHSNILTYMGPKNQAALKRVIDNPKNAGKTFSLANMADMVNQEKKNPTKQLENAHVMK